MARRILTDELIAKYIAREIDRQKLSEILGRTETELGLLFAKKKIKLWDRKIKTHGEVEHICKLYKMKKFNRDQLSQKFGISYSNLTHALIYRKITLWDAKRERRQTDRKKTSRYYDWREFKNHIMMNYNQ
jgi:DNA-binding Xre family transcriptional regulator